MSDDLKARLREAIIHATRGRPVRFHPTYCPEAKDAKFHEWDSSHDLSVIRPDGSRYRIGTFRHSDDARFDRFARELLPEVLRALVELEASNEEAYAKGFAAGQDALRQLGKLVVVDSPELQELRDALTASCAETAAVIKRAEKSIVNLASEFLAGGSPAAVAVLNLAVDRIRALATPDQTAAMGAVRAEARAQGMREAAYIAINACLVAPDGGNPTEEERLVCEEVYKRILAAIKGAKA